MWKALFYKWFGLEDTPCTTCEVLKEQLSIEQQLNKVLLGKLLDKPQTEPPSTVQEEMKPITPQFVPWRVKQQLLEQEDRRRAELLKNKEVEINKLEKELGVGDAAQ